MKSLKTVTAGILLGFLIGLPSAQASDAGPADAAQCFTAFATCVTTGAIFNCMKELATCLAGSSDNGDGDGDGDPPRRGNGRSEGSN